MNAERRPRGWTLIEILIVICCLAILTGPIVYVFRSGSRTALQGVVKSEITLEARRILQQIHDDLRYAVFFIDYSKPVKEKPEELFDRMLVPIGSSTYSLLRFPLHGTVGEAIRTESGAAYRMPVRVVYELRKEGPLFYSLYRREGSAAAALLSRRVNFLEIRENPAAPAKTVWLVTLQLAEATQATPSDANLARIEAARDTLPNAIERRLEERTRGVQIAEFFDVVASEFYSTFRRSRFIPNWHTLIAAPEP